MPFSSNKYRVRDEQKLVCMLKLLSKINAVSAVSDCRSKGCSGDEASDHCKITALVISGLKKKEKKRESRGPAATIQFSRLLAGAL